MLMFLVNLYDIDYLKGFYLIGVILTLFLFSMNNKLLLKENNTKWAIYIGIKITVLIYVSMHIYDLAPVVSVLFFMWAVACILIGIKKNQKYLRIYALVLSLISAVKLIMIDITYTDSISRAFSFIICGLLCFAISYIYSRIEKSTKQEQLKEN